MKSFNIMSYNNQETLYWCEKPLCRRTTNFLFIFIFIYNFISALHNDNSTTIIYLPVI